MLPATHKKFAEYEVSTIQLEAFDNSWTKRRLPNGLTVVHVPDPTDHFYLGILIKAGSRLESSKNSGTAHFLEHMLFRGSKSYPKFAALAEAFEWLGGDWNAETGREATEYWYSGMQQNRDAIIDLFFEFLENPIFSQIETERQIIKREMEGELNDHGNSTDLDWHMSQVMWPDSSMAQSILGTPETVDAIDHKMLNEFRDAFYVPQNMVLCAIGGPQEEVLEKLSSTFALHRATFSGAPLQSFPSLASAEANEAIPTPQLCKWIKHSDNELQIQISFRSEGEWSDKVLHYEIIDRILSDGFCSQLSKRIREELGLVYDIDSDAALYTDSGAFNISADVKPESLEPFLKETFEVLTRLSKNGPNAEEFAKAIFRAKVDMQLSLSEPEDLGSRLSWAHLCGKSVSLKIDAQQLNEVSSPDVTGTLQELFRKDNMTVVILGPTQKGGEEVVRKLAEKYF